MNNINRPFKRKVRTMKISTLYLRGVLGVESFFEHSFVRGCMGVLMCYLLISPLFAGVDGDMKASVEGLQKEIFGSGWVTVGKIGAAATGVVMSVAKMSLVPFVIGGLSSGGIHFFQKYTQAAAACLLS